MFNYTHNENRAYSDDKTFVWSLHQSMYVVDAFSDKDDKKSDVEHDEAAIAEARREAEERRKEKHRKMEEEREKMRQDIRDKVGAFLTYCFLL